MKKKILFFLIVVAGFLAVMQFLPRETLVQRVPVVATRMDTSVFIEPEAGRAPLIGEMNKAQHDILVEMYLLSDQEVIGAMQRAAARGVIVKVMLEEQPFSGGTLNQHTAEILKKSNIAVQWTNSAFSLTHEKVVTIDGREAFILNQNLTAAAFNANREYDVIDIDPNDVIEIASIFAADWQRQKFTLTTPHLLVSPYNARAAVETLLHSATKSIDIEMEVISDRSLEALIAAKAKTLPVRILIPDFTQIPANQDLARRLLAAGAQVHTLTSPYIHAKLILIDQLEAYIGSINLTTQSMDKNRELGIIIAQEKNIVQIKQRFEDDWSLSSAQ